jgi:hypothetical protein
MINTNNMTINTNDRLVIRWWDSKNKKIISQGKRLPNKATNLTKEIQHWYVKRGSVKAVRVIREILDLGLKDAFDILKYLRGEDIILSNPIDYKEMFGV